MEESATLATNTMVLRSHSLISRFMSSGKPSSASSDDDDDWSLYLVPSVIACPASVGCLDAMSLWSVSP